MDNYFVKNFPCYCWLANGHLFFSELCWGKAMVAYTKPQQRKKEESERLIERDQINLLILDLKDGKL